MKRIAKRSLAMLLAMVMLLSSTMSAMAAVPPAKETANEETAMETAEETTGSDEEAREEIKKHTDAASPGNAQEPEEPADPEDGAGDDEEAVYLSVAYELIPEEGGEISVKDEVKAGADLSFTVTPNEGYEIASVMVDSEELEADRADEETGRARYTLKDVMAEPLIQVEFAETETEETAEVEEEPEGDKEAEAEDTGAPYFVILLDEAEIKIEEADEGALEGVDSIAVEAVSQDDAIEEALLDQMKDGKAVADYAAFDIKLYDEEGEEVEPKGAVNVVISGVSTDEEYDEVGIYHVQEMQIQRARFFAAPAAGNALPQSAGSLTEDAADALSYHAQEVKKVDDRIEESGEISFVVDHFSTYVITFIKSSTEYVEINISTVVYDADGDNTNPVEIISNVEDINLNIGEDPISILQIVSGYDIAQIRHDESLYVYSFATWGSDPTIEDNKIEDSDPLTFEKLSENASKGIYLWYENVTEQMVPVSIDLGNGHVQTGDYKIPAGEIDYEAAQEAIKSISDGNVYAFLNATLTPKAGTDGSINISSVKLINGNYYVTLSGSTGSEESFSSDNWDVVLHFAEGHKITINVSGTDDNPGNTVEEVYNDRSYEREITSTTEVQIPITIAQGYRLNITDVTNAGASEKIYDSSDSNYLDRNYNLTFNGLEVKNDRGIDIVFTKIETKTIDFSHYKDEVLKGEDGSQYHDATVSINGQDLKATTGNVANLRGDGTDTLVITREWENKLIGEDINFILNALSINGTTIIIPEDPKPAGDPELLGPGDTEATSNKDTTIFDANGDAIANVSVEAKAKYQRELDGFRLVWVRTEITYTITFSDVKTNLVITNCNLVGIKDDEPHREARFRNLGDGVTGKVINSENEERNIEAGAELYKFPVTINADTEFGYYITGGVLENTDSTKNDLKFAGDWYDKRTVTINEVSGSLNYVDINTDKVWFSFKYMLGDTDEAKSELGKPFTLGLNDLMSANLEHIEEPVAIDGKTFVGWTLNKGDEVFYRSDAVGISRDMIMQHEDTAVEYEEVGYATITLYPKYVEASEAEVAPYTIIVYADNVEESFTDYATVNSYVQREAVKILPEVEAYIKSLEARGYVLNGTASDPRVIVKNDGSTVIELYYVKPSVAINFKAGEHGGFEVEGQTEIEITTYQKPGEHLEGYTPVGDDDYAFKCWSWNNPDGTSTSNKNLPATVPNVDTTYTANFILDENGDGEDDNNQIKVSFTIEEAGVYFDAEKLNHTGKNFTLDNDKKTVTYWLTRETDQYPAAPPKDVLFIGPDIERVLVGWKDDDSENFYNLSDMVPADADNADYIGVFADDLNGNGEPDTEDEHVTITFEAGEHGSFADGAKTLYENILEGITFDDARIVIPGTVADKGYVFKEWQADGTKVELSGSTMVPSVDTTYKAVFAEDKNGDGISDEDQGFQTATLKPYDTHAYSGGEQEDGFPELALRYVEGTRQVDDSVITAIVINGVRYEEKKTSDLFDAVYWQNGDVAARPDDDEGGAYNAAVVLKNEAQASVPGSATSKDGMLVDADDHRILAANYPVVIEAEYGDGNQVIYSIEIDPANLIVRYVNASDVYRPVAVDESQLVLDGEKAAAVVPAGAQLFVNGRSERPVDRKTAEIKLLSDEVLDLSDNRKQLLIDKGYETIGLDSETAEAQGYKNTTRYFDLVDYSNGNVWVSSSLPTDVYMPYPEGTDSDTEFTFLHFKGLHRENYYGDVPAAIAGADVEAVAIEKQEKYIKFSTQPGAEAFSPFMLIWKTDSSTTDPDQPGTDGPGTGDSTPVSVSSSSGDEDYYYTVGVNGQWVHMDNVDVNQPLDEPVPAGATAVDFPEWHRWKFFKSNGIMLYNQWAHIENPFAVDGQPRSGWFYFDHDGLMRYGWYLDARSGDWYYMHSVSDGMLGTMMTGWHYDESDKRWYYLDPATGAMVTGWKQIDGKWYYFNPTPFGETWTLDHGQSVWRFNGNTVRPFGSMYQNEMTPDGYYVDENGVWVQ